MDGPSTFSRWLKQRRKERDLTQEQLADRIGSSPETIRKIEAGRRRPSPQMVEVIADCLGVPREEWPAIVQFARMGFDPGNPQSTVLAAEGLRAFLDGPAHTNLPAERTTFVGRANEVDKVRSLLRCASLRLLTLTGPPGIGKTRLALRASAGLVEEFEHGVFAVSLAAVMDPMMVIPAICKTLGVKEVAGQPLAGTLANYLRNRTILLFLDNFEQVISAGQALGELLVACPGLKLLITSRAVLRVYGEQEFPVPALSLPTSADMLQLETVARCEAIDLFVQRAQAVCPDFTLRDEDVPAVVEICRQLDGLPLAIELAAARTKLLPPQALLPRLSNKLSLLVVGMRDLPARQRTLRGAIAWSYDLLNDEEKALFRRLSVFVGTYTLQAAEAVCAGGELDADLKSTHPETSDEQCPTPLLEALGSLIDKSLLRQVEKSGEPRFWMLRTLSEYAQERLAESGEEAEIKRRYAAYYLALAEAVEPHLTSGAREPWLDRLEAEHNNLRAALAWCQSDGGDPDMSLRLAGALGWFWFFHTYLSEGRDWLKSALAQTGDARHSKIGAKALNAAGRLAISQSDYALAYSWLEESVATWRAIGDREGLAYALSDLGIMAVNKGDISVGYSLIEEGVALFRATKDDWGLAFALDRLADAKTWLDDAEGATALYSESLELYRKVNDRWGITVELRELGDRALRLGDYDAARAMLEEALATGREMGDRLWVTLLARTLGDALLLQGEYTQAALLYDEAINLNRELSDNVRLAGSLRVLGHATLYLGNLERAEMLYGESLLLFRQLNDRRGMTATLAGMAGLACRRGRNLTAACLLGATAAVRDAKELYHSVDLGEYRRNLTETRDALDDEAFDAAWERGRAMTLEQAMVYAMVDVIDLDTQEELATLANSVLSSIDKLGV